MQPSTLSRVYLAWPKQPACKAYQLRNSRQMACLQADKLHRILSSQHLLWSIILHSLPRPAMEMQQKNIPLMWIIPMLDKNLAAAHTAVRFLS